MRADRLLAMLMFLQNRGRTTTNRLAEELEVSLRTVVRDLYALRVAGFPVYTERGPHGGVHLHEEFRLRLTDLTQNELTALFTLSVPSPLADLGMGAEAKGALLKLSASLPVARAGVEREVRARLYLDPSPWHASRQAVPLLVTLRDAVWNDRWVRATLLRGREIPVVHEIAPHALVAKDRTWYVIWLPHDGTPRVDRVSDVIEAHLLDGTFTRAPKFDLEAFWTSWAAEREANQWFYPVTLRAKRSTLPHLQRELGRHIERTEDAATDDAWIEVQMAFDSLEHARGALLAHGGGINVIEPEALRMSIADFAQRIVDTYVW